MFHYLKHRNTHTQKRVGIKSQPFCIRILISYYMAANCTFWVSSITFSLKMVSVSIKSFTV